MNNFKIRCAAFCIVSAVAVNGFASNTTIAQEQDIGSIQAEYSLEYPDGSRLKQKPTEVRIVTAEQMQKSVGSKIALGVLLFAFTGGTGFSGSSKDNMNGATIDALEDRSNIQITDPDALAARLQAQVNDALKASAEPPAKSFTKPLTVAGGMTSLIYESLTGDEAGLYRLKTDWVVYKRKESFSIFGPFTFVVDCGNQSTKPLSQKDWAENNYAMVKTEMDATIATCEQKVLAAVPALLKD
ncbi:MAG: hypothetical protein V4713_10080 [Pseudomonadota bacterium]